MLYALAYVNWRRGRVDSLAWLGLVLTEGGSHEEARAVLEEALAIEPRHAWVRVELLPALERAAGGP